jgi:pimeloyl-ACP methyl ester carboxylesterase
MVVIVVGIAVAASVGDSGTKPADCGLDPSWSCSAVSVPVDHFGGQDQPTIDVTYAVHGATHRGSAPRRVLLIATGGPGASGLDDGVWMLGAMSSRITDAFDVVTFDARGVGRSDGRDCPRASRDYDGAPITPTSAKALVTDCIHEADADGLDLHRYATVQVVEDIETIRQRLGVDRITLFGSSYGTVVAQAYAAAHPDRLDGLVLDAPIDRSLAAARMWSVAAHGFEDAVGATLGWCARDADCHAAMPDPSEAYRRLLDDFTRYGDLNAPLIGPNGNTSTLTLSREQFDTMTDSAMYDPTSRMAWLRALAANDHGDRRRLVHLYDTWTGPGSSSTFAYYATWCADVRASPTTDGDGFAAYMEALREQRVTTQSSVGIASSIAPCVFWPAQPGTWAPPPETTSVPTLLLTSTTDPITPESEARSIVGRLPLARLIETRGGGHGSLGASCPNDRMADFVVDGALPVGQTSICDGVVADPFIPLPTSPATDAENAALGLIWELAAAPELLTWNGLGTLRLGCVDGGRVTLANTSPDAGASSRVSVTLRDCEWATAATFSGDGTYDLSTGDADLHLHSPRGDIEVVSHGSNIAVTGTWDGKPASNGH